MADSCRDVEPLQSSWVDGELRAGERARVAAHLQHCARCRKDIHALRVTRSMLASLPARVAPSGVAVPPIGVPARIPPGGRALRRAAVRALAGAAAVVVAVGVTAFAVGGDPTPGARTVTVPVDVYVAEHLVRAVGGPVSTPVLPKARR